MNKIIVENDTMRFYSTPVPIPVGGSQWSKIFFMFSNEWEDLRKIAQFRQGELKRNVDIDSNNFCYVPNEILPDMCGELSIVGYPQDTASAIIATANSLMLNFVQGFESGGEPAVPPTPDLYQKLLKEFAESGGGNPDAVLYTKQELTEEQQEQARANIGAGQPVFAVNVTRVGGSKKYTADKTAAEIEAAYQAGCEIVCRTSVPIIGMGPVPSQLPLKSRRGCQIFMFAIDQTIWTDNSSLIVSYVVTIADDGVSVGQNNTEIYIKPASGIPKSDLEQSVQASLAKADTAISLGLTAATPGQIIKVKAVQDGKPTEWEAVNMPGEEEWEKIADIELRADTALYVLADFAVWRKAKVIMRRPKYISGLNKNVWCHVRKKNSASSTRYSCGYLTSEYGYVYWEFSAEVSNNYISSTALRNNNIVNTAAVLSTHTLTPLDLPPEGYELTLSFVDTSMIQEGDKVTVIGVRR